MLLRILGFYCNTQKHEMWNDSYEMEPVISGTHSIGTMLKKCSAKVGFEINWRQIFSELQKFTLLGQADILQSCLQQHSIAGNSDHINFLFSAILLCIAFELPISASWCNLGLECKQLNLFFSIGRLGVKCWWSQSSDNMVLWL